MAHLPTAVEGPIHCQPFVVVFTNSDVLVPGSRFTNEHNISIRAENLLGPPLFEGDVIGRGRSGTRSRAYLRASTIHGGEFDGRTQPSRKRSAECV